MLRVANERAPVTSGPYRWIRHPLYAFWIPVMTGWGLAARNWFILASGTVLILVLRIVRVPREEAMMVRGFGDSYRQYHNSHRTIRTTIPVYAKKVTVCCFACRFAQLCSR